MQWIGSPYPFSFPYSQGPIEDSCYPDANPDFCPLESSYFSFLFLFYSFSFLFL